MLVANPEKHGAGISAYLTYEVRTKMKGGAFGERDFTVRRRYAGSGATRAGCSRPAAMLKTALLCMLKTQIFCGWATPCLPTIRVR